jgi:integrase
MAADEAKGLLTAGKSPTVAAWLETWLDSYLPGDLKPATVTAYRRNIRLYLVPHLGSIQLDRLTAEDLDAMNKALRKNRQRQSTTDRAGLSENSLASIHATLAAALKLAVLRRKIQFSVADQVKRPKKVGEARRALTVDEAWAVLDVAEGPRFYLALLCGMRQGEVLALRWRDIDFEGRRIVVGRTVARIGGDFVEGTPKSAAGNRTIPLIGLVEEPLRAHYEEAVAAGLAGPDDLLFQGLGRNVPRQPPTDLRHWGKVLAKVGVEYTQLHAARNTTAHLLEDADVQPRIVADILGHSKVEQTFKYQAGNDPAREAAMETLNGHMLRARAARSGLRIVEDGAA